MFFNVKYKSTFFSLQQSVLILLIIVILSGNKPLLIKIAHKKCETAFYHNIICFLVINKNFYLFLVEILLHKILFFNSNDTPNVKPFIIIRSHYDYVLPLMNATFYFIERFFVSSFRSYALNEDLKDVHMLLAF